MKNYSIKSMINRALNALKPDTTEDADVRWLAIQLLNGDEKFARRISMAAWRLAVCGDNEWQEDHVSAGYECLSRLAPWVHVWQAWISVPGHRGQRLFQAHGLTKAAAAKRLSKMVARAQRLVANGKAAKLAQKIA